MPETVLAKQSVDTPLRIAIVAGEKSGDNLGAGLMQSIQYLHPNAVFDGIGGSAMLERGFTSLIPMERLSVMGFVEPLGRLPELLRIKKYVEQRYQQDPPDVFIGIDSPGFNLPVEKNIRRAGIKTVHYVSPSVWAYRENRIHKIKQAVDLMLVLFPFETQIYKQHQIPVHYVGHPLADSIAMADQRQSSRKNLGFSETDKIIALLPGSRSSEVKRLGSVFINTALSVLARYPDLKFVIPCASSERRTQIETLIGNADIPAFKLIDENSQMAMAAADLVLLASGTATLEAMLLKRPMVVSYKLATITYAIISRILKVPYVALPNLLAGKKLVPEYIQAQANVENLSKEIHDFMVQDQDDSKQLIREFESMHAMLQQDASAQAAAAVLKLCLG